MEEQVTSQPTVGTLPYARAILILSMIPIFLVFLGIFSGTFLGVFSSIFLDPFLLIIVLILGNKAQNKYMTNLDPKAWSNYSLFFKGIVCAIVSFVLCVYQFASFIGGILSRHTLDFTH